MAVDYTTLTISYDRSRMWWIVSDPDDVIAEGPTSGGLVEDARQIELTLTRRDRQAPR